MPDSEKSSDRPITATDPWTMAKDDFETDDGSLSGVVFEYLGLDSLTAIYDYFRVHGVVATKDAAVSISGDDHVIPVDECQDLVRCIVEGRCDSFHCCYKGISFESQTFPVLGLLIDPDSAEIDYRMGKGWNHETVNAFFRFLVHLRSKFLEPDVRITGPSVDQYLFSRVMNSVEFGDHASRS